MSNVEISLGILSIIGFVAALPQVWGSSWKDIWLFYRKDSISWDTVHKGYLKIVDKLLLEKFDPSVVIGIGRGGIVAAGLVCSEIVTDNLETGSPYLNKTAHTQKIKLGTINSTVYFKQLLDHNTQAPNGSILRVDRIELAKINIELQPNVRVLLLVAQTFSGSTLKEAISMVSDMGIPRENIKTATIFWHRADNIAIEHEPDLYGTFIKIDKTMPWKNNKLSTDRF